MTEQEYRKYHREPPRDFPFSLKDEIRRDAYGIYSTGLFEYGGKTIVINVEDGRWHLSVSANHTLGYYELKDIRYRFMPDSMHVVQMFPPRDEFVNLHRNCFHLWELPDGGHTTNQHKTTEI